MSTLAIRNASATVSQGIIDKVRTVNSVLIFIPQNRVETLQLCYYKVMMKRISLDIKVERPFGNLFRKK